MTAFTQRLSEQLAAMPGVEHAGLTTHLPLSGQNIENGFEVDGWVAAASRRGADGRHARRGRATTSRPSARA